MNTIYQSAVNAHFAEMQYASEYVPFYLWLERMKRKGMFWSA
jgi:hypothetical protein